MSLDPTEEPYVTLMSMVRSEVADLTVGIEEEDEEFTDEQICREINNSFLLKIKRDFSVSDTIVIVDGNLSVLILDDDKLLYPLVIASSSRILNIRLQKATASNIDITRSNKKISLVNFVKGLQNAVDNSKRKYEEIGFGSMNGIALIPNIDYFNGSDINYSQI